MDIYDYGDRSLEGLIREFYDVIKTKLEAEDPADIDPLRDKLKRDAIPVWYKQRSLPTPKREFMTCCVR